MLSSIFQACFEMFVSKTESPKFSHDELLNLSRPITLGVRHPTLFTLDNFLEIARLKSKDRRESPTHCILGYRLCNRNSELQLQSPHRKGQNIRIVKPCRATPGWTLCILLDPAHSVNVVQIVLSLLYPLMSCTHDSSKQNHNNCFAPGY
jgi:hypothetical protein